MIVGVDEAGRGPLAGSVVSCALYIAGDGDTGVAFRDSKKLSAAQRHRLFEKFREKSVFSVGLATPGEIDRLNILNATFVSFERAIKNLVKKAPYLKDAEFIIDGPYFKTRLPVRFRCVPAADSSVPQVAYASIVAKIFRDYLMQVADFLFPQWEFRKHKGYPTQKHYRLIKEHGISALHRRSFSLFREDRQ